MGYSNSVIAGKDLDIVDVRAWSTVVKRGVEDERVCCCKERDKG